MNILVGKVFRFLVVAVWGKINIWQFIAINKHYLILTASNVLLSLLFIYMAEQTTIRTDQYRAVNKELKQLTVDYAALSLTNQTLYENIETQRKVFSGSDVKVNTADILSDYEKWASEIAIMDEEVIKNQNRRLGVIREQEHAKGQ